MFWLAVFAPFEYIYVMDLWIIVSNMFQVEFHGLANYLADQWTPTSGCQSCQESKVHLDPAHVSSIC